MPSEHLHTSRQLAIELAPDAEVVALVCPGCGGMQAVKTDEDYVWQCVYCADKFHVIHDRDLMNNLLRAYKNIAEHPELHSLFHVLSGGGESQENTTGTLSFDELRRVCWTMDIQIHNLGLGEHEDRQDFIAIMLIDYAERKGQLNALRVLTVGTRPDINLSESCAMPGLRLTEPATIIPLEQRVDLLTILENRFDPSEIRTLCFDLGIKHEAMNRRTHSELIRSMLSRLITPADVRDFLIILRGQREDLVNEVNELLDSLIEDGFFDVSPEAVGASIPRTETPTISRNGQILELLRSKMNEGDVRGLCFWLGVEYSNIPGETYPEKLRELISTLQSQRRLADLLTWANNRRPDLFGRLQELLANEVVAVQAGVQRGTSSRSDGTRVEAEHVVAETVNSKQALLEFLDRSLSEGEVQDICFDLTVDYDNLPGGRSKTAKIMSLIDHLEQRRRMDELVGWFQRFRPDFAAELSAILSVEQVALRPRAQRWSGERRSSAGSTRSAWGDEQRPGPQPVAAAREIEVDPAMQELQADLRLGHDDQVILMRTIARVMNVGDLKRLCPKVGLEYDVLGGEGKTNKVRELVTYCERRAKGLDLLIAFRQMRPHEQLNSHLDYLYSKYQGKDLDNLRAMLVQGREAHAASAYGPQEQTAAPPSREITQEDLIQFFEQNVPTDPSTVQDFCMFLGIDFSNLPAGSRNPSGKLVALAKYIYRRKEQYSSDSRFAATEGGLLTAMQKAVENFNGQEIPANTGEWTSYHYVLFLRQNVHATQDLQQLIERVYFDIYPDRKGSVEDVARAAQSLLENLPASDLDGRLRELVLKCKMLSISFDIFLRQNLFD